MDYMDIDEVFDVPDTPDRLVDHNSYGNGCNNKETNSSMNNNPASKDYFGEAFRNRSREKSKLVTHSGSRRLFLRPENTSKSTVSALGESFSVNNSHPSGRLMVDNNAEYDNKRSSHCLARDKGKVLSSSQSQWPACKEGNTVVDLTEQNGCARVFDKAISNRGPRNDDFRKGSLSSNVIHPLHSTTDCLKAFGTSSQVKEKVDDTYKVGKSFGRGKGVDLMVDIRPKVGNTTSAFLQPSASCKLVGQKRLVRNGCISPLNIAKGNQSAEKHDLRTVAKEGRNGCISPLNIAKGNQSAEKHDLRTVAKEGQSDTGTVASDDPRPITVNIREVIADAKESHRFKGKGVSHHPFSSEELDSRSKHLPGRGSVTIKEPESGDASVDGSKCFEGLDGWRTTRNRTKKVEPPLADENPHFSRRNVDSFFNQQNKNEVVRRDHRNVSSARNLNGFHDSQDPLSCQHVSAPSQMVSRSEHKLGQINEHQKTANTLIKRQKQGSGSSNVGECSTSAFDDSEIVFLSPSEIPSSSRSTRNHNLHGVGDWNSVIEVDEFSPEPRNSGPNARLSSNEDSGVRTRQVEADEMLARELQEQLYNELPGVGIGEIDEHIALAMQQEESLQHDFPSGGHQQYNPSGSAIGSLHRQSQSRPSLHPPIRRSIPAGVHTSTRMARLRGRFPGRSRTLSSSSRNPMFPANMDVDTRMHILEALEAFSDIGATNELLQVDREFNENDYEMLLALDENNHQHGGASRVQINGLPQSTVQTDNLEECSVCLEIPTVGQTIRHLPCLHKFHKDCIDPWLRRKTSCPVCKSSIT